MNTNLKQSVKKQVDEMRETNTRALNTKSPSIKGRQAKVVPRTIDKEQAAPQQQLPSGVAATKSRSEVWIKFEKQLMDGRIASQRGLLSDSRRHYDSAVETAEQSISWPCQLAARKLAKAALCELDEDFARAKSLHEEAFSLVQATKTNNPDWGELQTVGHFYHGSVLRELNEISGARNQCLAVGDEPKQWRYWALNNLGDLCELEAKNEHNENDKLKWLVKALHCYESLIRIQRGQHAPSIYIEKYNCGRLHLRLRLFNEEKLHSTIAEWVAELQKDTSEFKTFQGELKPEFIQSTNDAVDGKKLFAYIKKSWEKLPKGKTWGELEHVPKSVESRLVAFSGWLV